MSNAKPITLSKTTILLVGFFCFYSAMVLVGLKSIIGFDSPDELLYIYFDQANAGLYGLGHRLWGWYTTYTYKWATDLPVLISLSILFVALYRFFNVVKVTYFQIVLMLTIPSILFFSLTYLRDISIMSAVLFVVAGLAKKNRSMSDHLSILLGVLWVCVFRSHAGAFVVLSILLSHSRMRGIPFYLFFPLVMACISLAILFHESFYLFYKQVVLSVEGVISNYGLVGFDKQEAGETESAITFLLNWIPYWATYHPLAIDSPMKLVFLYEAFVYFLLVIISLTYFSSAYYRTDSAYRFSIYMLLGSFVMATIESGNATVLRHKLVFVPCLFYLGYMNTKGMRLVIFKRFKRGFPLKRLSGEGSDGRVS